MVSYLYFLAKKYAEIHGQGRKDKRDKAQKTEKAKTPPKSKVKMHFSQHLFFFLLLLVFLLFDYISSSLELLATFSFSFFLFHLFYFYYISLGNLSTYLDLASLVLCLFLSIEWDILSRVFQLRNLDNLRQIHSIYLHYFKFWCFWNRLTPVYHEYKKCNVFLSWHLNFNVFFVCFFTELNTKLQL